MKFGLYLASLTWVQLKSENKFGLWWPVAAFTFCSRFMVLYTQCQLNVLFLCVARLSIINEICDISCLRKIHSPKN